MAALAQMQGSPAPENEHGRPRTAQSFCVPKADIEANGYDLSINRYKEVVHEAVQHRAPGGDIGAAAGVGGADCAGDGKA